MHYKYIRHDKPLVLREKPVGSLLQHVQREKKTPTNYILGTKKGKQLHIQQILNYNRIHFQLLTNKVNN